MSTAHHMREANKSTAQPKDDDLTEHYELNWCLRARDRRRDKANILVKSGFNSEHLLTSPRVFLFIFKSFFLFF